jgi:hypothetical protein
LLYIYLKKVIGDDFPKKETPQLSGHQWLFIEFLGNIFLFIMPKRKRKVTHPPLKKRRIGSSPISQLRSVIANIVNDVASKATTRGASPAYEPYTIPVTKNPILDIDSVLPVETTKKKKRSRTPNPEGKKRKRSTHQTPLQKFRLQTVAKKKELKQARKDIDKQLKHIEKDLGTLKRK